MFLSAATSHTPAVQRRRQLFWARFSTWHSDHLQVPAVALARASAPQAANGLAIYGQWLYDRGRSLLEYSEVVNSMVDLAPAWRRELNEPWAVAWAWKGVTDAYNHVPCPALVAQAFATALLQARRPVQAVALLLGFAALLRPIELARLALEDVVLPEDLGVEINAIFVKIKNPKNRRLAARLEHVRVDQPSLLKLARLVKAPWPADTRCFASYRALATEWHGLCSFFRSSRDEPAWLDAGFASCGRRVLVVLAHSGFVPGAVARPVGRQPHVRHLRAGGRGAVVPFCVVAGGARFVVPGVRLSA